MISNENTRWLTVALEKIKNCATMENSESTALHCVNESDFFLLCVCYIIVLKMPEIKNGILFPARFKQPLWSASRNLTTKGKPLLIHFIVKKYINEAGGVRWGLEGLTDCTLFMQNAKPRTTDTQRELFFRKFQTFGLGQTNWADKFGGIWGIFGQFISTHFGTVGPLSMFSIN